MFKASCDVCRKDVPELLKLQLLEVRLRSKDMNHICVDCQTKLNENLRKRSEEYGRKVAQDGVEWLSAHQKAKSGIITP